MSDEERSKIAERLLRFRLERVDQSDSYGFDGQMQRQRLACLAGARNPNHPGDVTSFRFTSHLYAGRQMERCGDLLRVVVDVEFLIQGQLGWHGVDCRTNSHGHDMGIEVGSEVAGCLEAG